MALELSFLESNVRLLADELAELNGSVDVYQYRDDEDDYNDQDDLHGIDRRDSSTRMADETVTNRQRRRQRQMPMIAVPLKDTRPIDFRLPLEVSIRISTFFYFLKIEKINTEFLQL